VGEGVVAFGAGGGGHVGRECAVLDALGYRSRICYDCC
jgi:hypothetical protein